MRAVIVVTFLLYVLSACTHLPPTPIEPALEQKQQLWVPDERSWLDDAAVLF